MTDKKIGSWDFANFYQRPPEPTPQEKQAYAFRRIFYKPPPAQPLQQPLEENLLSDEEQHGVFLIGTKKININKSMLIPEDLSQPQLFGKTRSITSTATRVMLTRKSNVLEDSLTKTYPHLSMAPNFSMPAKLSIINGVETTIPALMTIDFSFDAHTYQALVFLPHPETSKALYQVNDLTLDSIIGTGVIVTHPSGNNKLYEIRKFLTLS